MIRRRKNNRRGRSRVSRGSPYLYTFLATSIAGGTQVDVDLFVNGQLDKLVYSQQAPKFQIFGGATSCDVFFIVRRVPQGYAVPIASLGGGTNTFEDVDNVLSWGILRFLTTNTTPTLMVLKTLKSSVPLNVGDNVYLTVVPSVSSVGLLFDGEVMYRVRSA